MSHRLFPSRERDADVVQLMHAQTETASGKIEPVTWATPAASSCCSSMSAPNTADRMDAASKSAITMAEFNAYMVQEKKRAISLR